MKWMETIELRATTEGDTLEEIDLHALTDTLPAARRPYRVVLLRHAAVEGDISIHLLFDTDRVPAEGSEPGLRLKEMLRSSGLVSHKIWLETARYPWPADNRTP